MASLPIYEPADRHAFAAQIAKALLDEAYTYFPVRRGLPLNHLADKLGIQRVTIAAPGGQKIFGMADQEYQSLEDCSFSTFCRAVAMWLISENYLSGTEDSWTLTEKGYAQVAENNFITRS